jgi:hypothetical protein
MSSLDCSLTLKQEFQLPMYLKSVEYEVQERVLLRELGVNFGVNYG